MSSAKSKSGKVLKPLKGHNTYWHPDSTLVMKSKKERVVIGRYVDDELIPLDEEALELCETWKFNPDESLLEIDAEEEPVEEPEEETAEPDEEETAEPEEETAEPDEEEPVEEPEEETPEKIEEPVVKKTAPVKKSDTVKKTTPVKKSDTVKTDSSELGDDNFIVYENINSQQLQIVRQMNTRLTELLERNQTLSQQLEEIEKSKASLQEEYENIQKKFHTMKSLFSS